jgi:hypothetical protein
MRRRFARLTASLLGLCALAAAPAAVARTFYVLQSGADAWTVMDPFAAQEQGMQVRRASTVRVQRNILASGAPQPGYVRTQTEYDCARGRTRWLEFSAFSRSGALLARKANPDPQWRPASEAPDIEAAYRVVCNGDGAAAVVEADSIARVVVGLMAAWDQPAARPGKATSKAARGSRRP